MRRALEILGPNQSVQSDRSPSPGKTYKFRAHVPIVVSGRAAPALLVMKLKRAIEAGPLDRVERTFMFTDIVASTSELERVGSEAWSQVISHLRDVVCSVADDFGGRLVAFLGDGFLVIFDTPAGGLLGALMLQDALLNDADLGVRIGVESGPVVCLGADDYVGLCLHTASRLCDLSGAGQAFIGDGCFRAAEQDVHLPQLERTLLPIRGLRQPVTAYLSPVPAVRAAV